MPNRILKESICTSDNLDQLSAFQETMFYRLIVSCDDYGRMDARPKILASRLFPLKDIRANQIEDGLRALTSAELVILYEVDGKPFLQMKTWDCHQQVRARKSKFPGPDEGVISSDINCNQMISDDCNCSRNPIQSNPNPNPIRESESESVSESTPHTPQGGQARGGAFERFWAVYPKKVGKQAAFNTFQRIKGVSVETMVKAVEYQRSTAQWQKDNGRFIPNPATWLNQGRWEDEGVTMPERAPDTPTGYAVPPEDAFGDIDRLIAEMQAKGQYPQEPEREADKGGRPCC